MSRAPTPQANLPQPQNGHIVDLADLLLDCEPSISHNYYTLQALCNEYKDKEMTESKMAELLVKLANSVKNNSDAKEKSKGDGMAPGALYFQTLKPSIFL